MQVTFVALKSTLDRLGGLQLRIRSLIEGLIDRGFEVRIIQFHSSAKGSKRYADELANSKFEILDIPDIINASPLSYFSSLKRVNVIISKMGSDIIDSYEPIHPIRGIPFVYSSIYFLPYSIDMLLHFRFRLSSLYLLKNLAELRMIKQADGYIVEHSRNESYLRSIHGIDAKKIKVLPYGYDIGMISRIERNRMHDKNHRIAFAGRLINDKGISILLHAFRDVHAEYPDWKLIFMGDGLDNLKLRRRITEMGLQESVEFTGYIAQEETLQKIADSSIFVMPSLFEGLPSSVIQAMAIGVPVISSDVGGIKQDLIMNGENGILVRRGSSSDLADKLRELMRDEELRRKIGAAGLISAKEITTDRMINGTIRFYEKLIAQGH